MNPSNDYLRTLTAALACATVILMLSSGATALETSAVMVAAEQGLAAEAGVRILAEGGNAIDAASGAALAVGVTNPSSCGIGGGGFMLIYIARTKKIYALDYRERAPARATAELYSRDGRPREQLLLSGPLAVATPGEIAGINQALSRFGTMEFSEIARPAVELARDGFPCGDHLAAQIADNAAILGNDPGLSTVFLHSDGTPRQAGEKIIEARLAATLKRLGDRPVENFYRGAVARAIADFLKQRGGALNQHDLAAYKPIWRPALHRRYRQYEVYTMPPPSSGGVLLEMFEMLAPGNLSALGVNSPAYLARLIETMRQAFIDRTKYYGDPDFVSVPIGFLLSPEHVAELNAQALNRASKPEYGVPEDHGTSHLCVVDRDHNVVSLTTTINTAFGAKMMVPELGVILNDEMDDFAIAPGVANVYGLAGGAANAIEPRKRPLSSMTPTIITKGGAPRLALGGSGGPTIITMTLQVALDILDFHLEPEQGIELPRIHEQAAPVVAVEASMPEATREALARMGYKLRIVPALGAEQAILIAQHELVGASDPRKAGDVAGF